MKAPFCGTEPKTSSAGNRGLSFLSYGAKFLKASSNAGPVKKSPLVLVLVACLLAVSLWNSWCFLRQSYHWPLFSEDELTRLDRDLDGAKIALSELPDRNIGYRVEEASEAYDTGNFFKLQYALAPSILWSEPSEARYVIVEFWKTKKVKPLPGLMFLKDFGRGMALYRRL
jgi:hypothetical protein